jgi:hypothetical protein
MLALAMELEYMQQTRLTRRRHGLDSREVVARRLNALDGDFCAAAINSKPARIGIERILDKCTYMPRAGHHTALMSTDD